MFFDKGGRGGIFSDLEGRRGGLNFFSCLTGKHLQ